MTAAVTLLVDGTNLLIRSHFAYPDLRSPRGEPTGALFGLVWRVFEAVERYDPASVTVFFDGGRAAWRRRLLPAYKDRPRAEDRRPLAGCFEQKPAARDFLATLGADVVEVPGAEADDLIARAAAAGPAVILSTDRDFWQLVDAETSVFQGVGKDARNVTAATFAAVTGWASPAQWLAYRVVNGDASDNVPRVGGGLSGEKRFAAVWSLLAGELSYGGDPVAFFVDAPPPPARAPAWSTLPALWARLTAPAAWTALGRNALLMDLRYAVDCLWLSVHPEATAPDVLSAGRAPAVAPVIVRGTTAGAWDRRAFERSAARYNFASVVRELTRWVDAFGRLDARRAGSRCRR